MTLPEVYGSLKNRIWYQSLDYDDYRVEEVLYADCPADVAEFKLGSKIKMKRLD